MVLSNKIFYRMGVVQYRQINACSRRTLYNIDKSTQARLRCIVARSGTKLERTSLSTDGSIAPAFDLSILYNYTLKKRSLIISL